MKTLKKHVIIYDDECPLCDLYTGGFIKSGMLDADGRIAFSKIDEKIEGLIDRRRACNEIALVNEENGDVLYGTESLSAIIANSYPFLKPLFRFPAFKWIVRKLYSFISYNRKVIIPGNVFEEKNSCVPDFNRTYRWAYIIFGCILTGLVLNAYAKLLTSILPSGTLTRELAICAGQVLFQSAFVGLVKRERLLHYLGNMITISIMGALLLLPVLFIAQAIELNSYAYLSWFTLVVGLMFLEHWRRVKILEIHWSASLSWALYRLIVLWIIF